jgi:hypothetical protein
MDRNVDRRRRKVVLTVSSSDTLWLGFDEIVRLDSELALDYAGKNQKTFARDIEKLEEIGLIERKDRKIRAKRETILAFLPTRVEQPRTEQDKEPALVA